MPETPPPAGAHRVCAASDLADNGRAVLFDLLEYGRPVRGFVLRFQGQVVGYLNRCAHVPAEMDWQPGHFLDDECRHIVCSIHGALYDPATGTCLAGPGGRGRLKPLTLLEAEGQVYWYPSAELQPAAEPDKTSEGDGQPPAHRSLPP